MAKRFTDTEKWDRPWFRGLPNLYKLLWCFVLDKCDIAGIWYVDMEMASFQIGTKIDRLKAENVFEKQIEIKADRWLIKDFISFQYGSLEASNRIYKNVTAKLASFKEGASMPLISPSDGVMVMVMDKDKDKDYIYKAKPRSAEEVADYAASIGFSLNGQSFIDYYEAAGWMRGKNPIKDWRACVRTWKLRREESGDGKKEELVG